MKRGAALAIILAASPLILAAGPVSNWTVGQEREVDAGTYAKLMSQAGGWRVWRFETSNGRTCRAVKSAMGRGYPYPLGVGSVLRGATPFLEADSYTPGALSVTLSGSWGGGKAEYRSIGERFWTAWKADMPLADWDGKKLQVHITTWEYPEIMVGMADETGILDLTGAKQAIAAVDACIKQ